MAGKRRSRGKSRKSKRERNEELGPWNAIYVDALRSQEMMLRLTATSDGRSRNQEHRKHQSKANFCAPSMVFIPGEIAT